MADDDGVDDRTRAAAPPAGARRAWAPGERAGPFLVTGLLGQGGMGAVYAVRHGATGAEHALKVLLALEDPTLRARFAREGQAQASLPPHPNVVQVVGAGELQGVPYLLTELAPGGDLRGRLLREGPLPPLEAARIFAALARALAHLHAHGVLHRDLKPHNIVFGADGAPKLMDFGLATLRGAERLTVTGAFLGTPNYMAPEQVDGQRVDARADVFGLGATLYHALCGQPPFDGEAEVNLISKVLTAGPRPLRSRRPELPPDLLAVVERAMAREAAARFPTAAALAEALEQVSAGRPIGRAPRRPRAPLALAVGLAFLAGLGVAALVRARPAGPAPGPGPATAPVASAAAPPVWDPTERFRLVPFDQALLALPALPEGLRFTLGIDVETTRTGELPLAPGLNELFVRRGLRPVARWPVVRLPRGVSVDGDVATNDADGSRLVFVDWVARPGRPAAAPFLIGELEVTWGQFRRWRRDPAYRLAFDGAEPRPRPSPAPERLPVVGTIEAEALDYCARVGLRLPTTEEWSHACWGGREERYPWGEAPADRTRGNLRLDGEDGPGPLPVGSFPLGRTWCGALDMFGNADEWVDRGQGRIGRTCGPSWGDPAELHEHRDGEQADVGKREPARGFRVACDLRRAAPAAPLPP